MNHPDPRVDVVGNKGYMEYMHQRRVLRPVRRSTTTSSSSPTGRELRSAAALVAEFTGDKISAFRNYFDDVTLLEQMLAE